MPATSPSTALNKFATFGDLLKYLRRRAGLTQLELSIAVGYSDTQISRFEQNLRSPDLATIAARFVPALHLENEPDVMARLLELATFPEAPTRPNAPPRPKHNLPAPLTRFIGREQQIEEVKRLLSATRLVTLSGMGGCGKTRLALQVATQLLDEFSDGVWQVELAPITEPARMPQTVMAALAMGEKSDRAPIESLVQFLRDKCFLLILDNCEHLTEACALLATALLRACPTLKILATSREALNVGGESVWPVPPLILPNAQRAFPGGPGFVAATHESEAVQLFLDRATGVHPAFRLSETNALAVAQVCRRLDGIPLAIELAAARVGVLSVEQIAVRLDDCFQLLTGGSRAAPPRQQTLRAAFDWSYDLLSETEQVLLRRLSIFTTNWTLAAAETVCADIPGAQAEASQSALHAADVLDALTMLVNKSLVMVQPETGDRHYRLLDTIRQYARNRLQAADEETLLHGRYRWWRWRNRVARQANAHQKVEESHHDEE